MKRWMLVACLALAATQAQAQKARPDLGVVERAVIEGTNELRREKGLPELERNAQLARAARGFADFMASRDEYGHEADGRTPTERARAAGYKDCMVAENIAYQFRTWGFESRELAAQLVKGWFNSPGHRRNLLDADATEIGAAVAHSEETGRYYGVQVFGRPQSMRVAFEVRNESRAAVEYRVGQQAFKLPPRSERRHQVCTELALVFERRGGEPKFMPGNGERFVVTPAGRVDHQRE